MSRRFTQFLLFLMSRSFPAWILVLVLPVVAGAENAKPTRPRPVSDGMELVRQGIAGNMCALTFDDGPSQYTAQLLDILREYNVKATFFVVGTQVKRRPELIKRMLAEGHEVGNHSYSHNTLRRLPAEEQQADLRKLDGLLRELGANPRFVRPPYGFYDHNTVNAVQEMDGHLVMWSVDSQDWRKKANLENLSAMQMMYSGAPLRGVFLFHDTHRLTVERMPQILATLAATDCRFVTLSEYIGKPKTQPEAPAQAAQTAQAAPHPATPTQSAPAPAGAPPRQTGLQAPTQADAAVSVSSLAPAPAAPVSPAQPPAGAPGPADTNSPPRTSILDTILGPLFRLFNSASPPPAPVQQSALLSR